MSSTFQPEKKASLFLVAFSIIMHNALCKDSCDKTTGKSGDLRNAARIKPTPPFGRSRLGMGVPSGRYSPPTTPITRGKASGTSQPVGVGTSAEIKSNGNEIVPAPFEPGPRGELGTDLLETWWFHLGQRASDRFEEMSQLHCRRS